MRRAAFLKRFSSVIKTMRNALAEIHAGLLTDDARNALFFEANRLAGSLETLGWYREAEFAAEIKEKLTLGRAISRRDLGRIEFLLSELARVANC